MGEQLNLLLPPDNQTRTGQRTNPIESPDVCEISAQTMSIQSNNTATTMSHTCDITNATRSQPHDIPKISHTSNIDPTTMSHSCDITKTNSVTINNGAKTVITKFNNIAHYLQATRQQLEHQANNLEVIKQWWDKISPSKQTHTSNTPIISIHINGNKIKGLFDTGAGASVISMDTCSKSNCIITPTTQTCRAADKSNIQIMGETTSEVELGGRKKQQRFLVVEKLNHPIIFGIDFITEWGIIPLLYNNEFCFNDDREVKIKFLHSSAPTTINVIETTTKNTLNKFTKRARDLFSTMCDLTIRRSPINTEQQQKASNSPTNQETLLTEEPQLNNSDNPACTENCYKSDCSDFSDECESQPMSDSSIIEVESCNTTINKSIVTNQPSTIQDSQMNSHMELPSEILEPMSIENITTEDQTPVCQTSIFTQFSKKIGMNPLKAKPTDQPTSEPFSCQCFKNAKRNGEQHCCIHLIEKGEYQPFPVNGPEHKRLRRRYRAQKSTISATTRYTKDPPVIEGYQADSEENSSSSDWTDDDIANIPSTTNQPKETKNKKREMRRKLRRIQKKKGLFFIIDDPDNELRKNRMIMESVKDGSTPYKLLKINAVHSVAELSINNIDLTKTTPKTNTEVKFDDCQPITDEQGDHLHWIETLNVLENLPLWSERFRLNQQEHFKNQLHLTGKQIWQTFEQQVREMMKNQSDNV